jgi:putative transposase
MVSAPGRRSQVSFATNRGLSVRRACALIGVARSTMGYRSRMAVKDGPVVTVMRELSSLYPRYGYRRIQVFLARRGHEMGPERAHRLWRQAGGSKYRENGPGGV